MIQREAIIINSKSGAYIEIFEWNSTKASADAYSVPAVREIWDEMGRNPAYTPRERLP